MFVRGSTGRLLRDQESLQLVEAVRGHQSLERARNQTLAEVGDLGHDKVRVVGRIGAGSGRTVGFSSVDGKRGFRVDYDPAKGPHFNWYDWSAGHRGRGGRWGAEVFPGDESAYHRLLASLGTGSISAG